MDTNVSEEHAASTFRVEILRLWITRAIMAGCMEGGPSNPQNEGN
jgi:hypothetical protein